MSEAAVEQEVKEDLDALDSAALLKRIQESASRKDDGDGDADPATGKSVTDGKEVAEPPKDPAEKEAEGKPAGEKAPDGLTAEDAKDLEGIRDEKIKQALIRERIAHRKQREEWEREKADIIAKISERPNPEPAEKPANVPAESRSDAGPKTASEWGQVFRLRAAAQQAIDGFPVEGMTKDQAKRVFSLSQTVLSELTDVGVLTDVITAAQRGEFGDLSDDVLRAARSELPVVTVKAERVSSRQKSERDVVEKTKQAIATEIAKAKDKYPALKDNTSSEYKFAADWMAREVGTAEKPGPLAYLAGDVTKVDYLFSRMMNDYAASRVRTLEEENALLKQRSVRQPMGAGGAQAPVDAGSALKESDKIKQELMKRHPGLRI